jgi:hypothetical protein
MYTGSDSCYVFVFVVDDVDIVLLRSSFRGLRANTNPPPAVSLDDYEVEKKVNCFMIA